MAVTIKGTIVQDVNQQDQPVQGVKVNLIRRYAVVDTQTTDNGGMYTFNNVSPGRYRVQPQQDDCVFDPEEERAEVANKDFTVPQFTKIALVTSASTTDEALLLQTAQDSLAALQAVFPAWAAKYGIPTAQMLAKEFLAGAFPPIFAHGRDDDGLASEEDVPYVTVAYCVNRFDTPNTPFYHNQRALTDCLALVGRDAEEDNPGEGDEDVPLVTVKFCVNRYMTPGTPYYHNKLALAQCLAQTAEYAEQEITERQVESFAVAPSFCLNRYTTPGTAYYHNRNALVQCLYQCG